MLSQGRAFLYLVFIKISYEKMSKLSGLQSGLQAIIVVLLCEVDLLFICISSCIKVFSLSVFVFFFLNALFGGEILISEFPVKNTKDMSQENATEKLSTISFFRLTCSLEEYVQYYCFKKVTHVNMSCLYIAKLFMFQIWQISDRF